MTKLSSGRKAALVVLGLITAGCAGSGDGGLLESTPETLAGTWEYLVLNAYEATFTGCTGDASALEGLTFAEALLERAPICVIANSFEVVESAEALTVQPHQVSCADGSSATMTGTGTVTSGTLSGRWDSLSEGGVNALQVFSGSIVGDTIEITEGSRTFQGSFQGVCSLSPPLIASVRIL